MGLATNRVYHRDCIDGLSQITPGSIDLVFADPPFNIGYEYDVYEDSRASDDYLQWSREWISGVSKALKPTGTFWLAIGDEYAAELKLIAQNDFKFACRSWVIWYYTFGVNCTRAFSRSHTHLFYFVKDPRDFTFNAANPAVRVPSARQLVYADRRANPKGRLPDNTWILRPQDVPDGFAPDHDTWYFPRIAGTFKEREGFHGCQMPEQLLGRIIRCCSDPMETVLDPFGGSGTTFAVAKKLGRQWMGFELSTEYVKRISARLKTARVGAPLDGAADPLSSAPSTASRQKSPRRNSRRQAGVGVGKGGNGARSAKRSDDFQKGLVDAYKAAHNGCSVDQVLADPELGAAFLDACKRSGLPGSPVQWNRSLLRIRKSGKLPRLDNRARTFTFARMDPYIFASEIALHRLSVEYDTTLDEILCDPQLAARFDEIAEAFSPGYTPFDYRWAALWIRKRAKDAKKLAKDRYKEWLKLKLPRAKPISGNDWSKYECPGVYLLASRNRQELYVGQTLNVRNRIEKVKQLPCWKSLQPSSVRIIRKSDEPLGLKSFLIHKINPVMNSRLFVPDLEPVA